MEDQERRKGGTRSEERGEGGGGGTLAAATAGACHVPSPCLCASRAAARQILLLAESTPPVMTMTTKGRYARKAEHRALWLGHAAG